MKAVFQQQNVPLLDGRHIGGAPDPRQGVEVAANEPAPHPTCAHRDQPVWPALLGPALLLPVKPLLGPLRRGRHCVRHGGATGLADLAKARQGLVHQRRELAKRGHQRRSVEGDEAGAGMNAEQQGRHVGVANDDFGVAHERIKIEIGQQGVGVAAANHRHDAAHLWIANEGIELGSPGGDGAGAPVIALAGEAARLESEALPFQKRPGTGKAVWRPGGGRTGGGEKADGIAGLEPRRLEYRHRKGSCSRFGHPGHGSHKKGLIIAIRWPSRHQEKMADQVVTDATRLVSTKSRPAWEIARLTCPPAEPRSDAPMPGLSRQRSHRGASAPAPPAGLR